MIKSMTGFGRSQRVIDNKDILVEIRSVNNRYFDFFCKIPRVYNYLEKNLKMLANKNVSRGKVEIAVYINNVEGVETQVVVNKSVAENYINALKSANEYLNINDDLSLSHIIRLPDVFTVTKTQEDEEVIWNNVSVVVNEALEKFIKMRETEGEKLSQDILQKLLFIENAVSEIEDKSVETTENYRNKLTAKLNEVLKDNNIDEQRIITEAAIFSEKVAVDEETVRLRSHIQQFRDLLNLSEPIGRKLDFLVQEINREVNTIGSKAQNLEITKIVVDLKSEIEKIREQIQNIE